MAVQASKFFNHLKTVLRHKYEVYKAMKMCGKGWQGLWHDMSKFSHIEFSNSVKYYIGTGSPINEEKKDKGYSDVWLHHKGRNKHHSQYWIDYSFGKITCAEIPWKYLLEYICDGIGAGKVYAKNNGEIWTNYTPLNYWENVDSKSIMNENTWKKLDWYYHRIAKYGWQPTAEMIRVLGDIYELGDDSE